MQKELHNKILSKQYIRILRLLLYPIAAWPGELFGEKTPFLMKLLKYLLPLLCVIHLMSQLYFAVYYLEKLSTLMFGDVCLGFCLFFLSTFCCSLPLIRSYEWLLEDYVKKYHLIYYGRKHPYHKQIYDSIEMVSDYVAKLIMLAMVTGVILFNAVPITKSIRNGVLTKDYDENITIEFAGYWKYPGYDQQEKPYILTTLINVVISSVCSFSAISLDLLMALMVFQIIGHIKLLEFNLTELSNVVEGLPRSQDIVCNNMFNSDIDNYMNRALKSCIKHHCLIISFGDKVSSHFGPVLALNYLFDLFACCLSLFECLQGDSDALARFGPLTIIIFWQLVQMSVTYEFMSIASEKLPPAVYSVPWERMGADNRRMVSIMLMRMQTPIEVTALGITRVGVQTMASVLKTTFSYLTILRSMSQ